MYFRTLFGALYSPVGLVLSYSKLQQSSGLRYDLDLIQGLYPVWQTCAAHYLPRVRGRIPWAPDIVKPGLVEKIVKSQVRIM
jgi:hypothetical protein